MRNTLVTNRGRHRRSFWLGFGPVAVALVLLALLLAPTAAAAPVNAEYSGERWPSNTKPVCFTTDTISDRRWVTPLKSAVYAWDSATENLRVIARPDCKASGYTEYVKVFAKSYGRTPYKACGSTKNWRGCARQGVRYWREVPSGGPWTEDGWTRVYGYGQAIQLNSHYGVSFHTALHEVGHLLGVDHPNRYTTYAAMATTSTTTSPGRLTFWDTDGWVGNNKPGVDAIYRHG